MILHRRKIGRSPCDDCVRNPRTGERGNCPRIFQSIEQHYIDSCSHYRPPDPIGPGTITTDALPPEGL